MEPSTTPPAREQVAVFFDGACPVCTREIDVYRKSRGGESVAWIDAARCDRQQLCGLDRDAALARLHVRLCDGTMVSGAAAFAAIWQQLPAFGRAARLARLPGVLPILELGYRGFLRMRTIWRRPVLPYPREVLADLRTDHAGETGAVMIYLGILAITRDESLRRFAEHHLATERTHLAAIDALLPSARRSLLTPLWRLAGWLTGALPACTGPRAVFATIAAVETFVDRHYAEQIARIDGMPGSAADPALLSLRALMLRFQADEVAHRDEAGAALATPPRGLLRLWTALVGQGSAAAVAISRRI
jgi:3-demethoxyubiquinol 3-hydroxylase